MNAKGSHPRIAGDRVRPMWIVKRTGGTACVALTAASIDASKISNARTLRKMCALKSPLKFVKVRFVGPLCSWLLMFFSFLKRCRNTDVILWWWPWLFPLKSSHAPILKRFVPLNCQRFVKISLLKSVKLWPSRRAHLILFLSMKPL